MGIFVVPAQLLALVLVICALVWPIGGGMALLITACAVGFFFMGMIAVMRPPRSTFEMPWAVVKRKYFVALLYPLPSQIYARSIGVLAFACLLLLPIELARDAGRWWLGVLGLAPWFIFSNTMLVLNPWAHIGRHPYLRDELEEFERQYQNQLHERDQMIAAERLKNQTGHPSA